MSGTFASSACLRSAIVCRRSASPRDLDARRSDCVFALTATGALRRIVDAFLEAPPLHRYHCAATKPWREWTSALPIVKVLESVEPEWLTSPT